MGEVGANGPAMHAEVGAYASERGIDVLLAFGPASAHAAQAFGAGARTFDSMDELNRHLPSLIPAHILRSEEHTSELQSLMRNSYALLRLKKQHLQQHNYTTR